MRTVAGVLAVLSFSAALAAGVVGAWTLATGAWPDVAMFGRALAGAVVVLTLGIALAAADREGASWN